MKHPVNEGMKNTINQVSKDYETYGRSVGLFVGRGVGDPVGIPVLK